MLVEVMKMKLKKGEMISKLLNDISVIKWKYKREVHMVTNASILEVDESVNRHEIQNRNPMPFTFIIKTCLVLTNVRKILPFRVEKNCWVV